MKKASAEEIRFAEIQRNQLIYTRNTIRRLLRARETEIKKTNGVYDEIWRKYKDDLRLTNKLIKDYDKFLDEQGVYHSNSHTEEDLAGAEKQKLSSIYGEVHNAKQTDQV